MTARVSKSHALGGAVVILGAIFAAACASAGSAAGVRAGSRCPLEAKDSVFLAGGPVYRDCAVDRKAEPIADVHPEFRADPTTRCYSAEIEFVVNKNGLPEEETARILHATDRRFAEAVYQTIPRLRYHPALRGGAPVRQIVDFKSAMQSVLVAVPAGSAPPTRPPMSPPPC